MATELKNLLSPSPQSGSPTPIMATSPASLPSSPTSPSPPPSPSQLQGSTGLGVATAANGGSGAGAPVTPPAVAQPQAANNNTAGASPPAQPQAPVNAVNVLALQPQPPQAAGQQAAQQAVIVPAPPPPGQQGNNTQVEPATVPYPRGLQDTLDWEITFKIVKATLTVNYRKTVRKDLITKMDPYYHIHMGNRVYKSPPSKKGNLNPNWKDCFFTCKLPRGINEVYIELFDQRLIFLDDLIAWKYFKLPKELFQHRAYAREVNIDCESAYTKPPTSVGKLQVDIKVKPIPAISLSLKYSEPDADNKTTLKATAEIVPAGSAENAENKMKLKMEATINGTVETEDDGKSVTCKVDPAQGEQGDTALAKLKAMTLTITVTCTTKQGSMQELRKVVLPGVGGDRDAWGTIVDDLVASASKACKGEL